MADLETVIASLKAAGIGETGYMFVRNATENAHTYARKWRVQADALFILLKEIHQIEREYDVRHLLNHLKPSDQVLLRGQIRCVILFVKSVHETLGWAEPVDESDAQGSKDSSSAVRHLIGSIKKQFVSLRHVTRSAQGRPSSSKVQDLKATSRIGGKNLAFRAGKMVVKDLEAIKDHIIAYRNLCKVLSDSDLTIYTSPVSDTVTLAPLASKQNTEDTYKAFTAQASHLLNLHKSLRVKPSGRTIHYDCKIFTRQPYGLAQYISEDAAAYLQSEPYLSLLLRHSRIEDDQATPLLVDSCYMTAGQRSALEMNKLTPLIELLDTRPYRLAR